MGENSDELAMMMILFIGTLLLVSVAGTVLCIAVAATVRNSYAEDGRLGRERRAREAEDCMYEETWNVDS